MKVEYVYKTYLFNLYISVTPLGLHQGGDGKGVRGDGMFKLLKVQSAFLFHYSGFDFGHH